MTAKTRVLTAIALVLLIASPAFAYKKINVRYPVWPSNPLGPSIKQLAIMDFGGPGGSEFSDQLIQSLLRDGEVDLNGRTVPGLRKFDIIERSRMATIVKEQNLSASGRIDDATAAEYGKIAGVDAIMIGAIAHDPKSENSRRVIETKTGSYYEPCVTNSVRSSFNGRIIEVNTGKILAVFDFGAFSGESRACGADKKPTSLDDQIQMNTIFLNARIATSLIGTLTYEEREFEKIKTKEYQEVSQRAAEMAETGNLAQAYVLYKSVYDQDPYCAGCAYNLGVMHEAVGNYRQAIELYQAAVNMESGNKDMAKALQAATNCADGLAKTQQVLGIEWPDFEFQVDARAMDLAMKAKVVTAGKKSDRNQAFDGPNGAATLKIPGELEVTLLEDSGAWVKVSLPDGKEAWLQEVGIDKGSLKKARKSAGGN